MIPIDANCIDASLLEPAEVAWLDAYHAEVRANLAPRLEGRALDWMLEKTEPLAT